MTKTGLQRGFIHFTKKGLVMGFIVWLIIISSGIYLIFFRAKEAKAEWYDETWAYRTSYSNNNTGSAVTNQKIKLDIDTATLYTNGKIQSDCDDSRFTDQNGNLLDYFIDTNEAGCNNASTDYYVIVPTINSGRTIIYHYYGNPQATKGRKDDFLPPSSAPTLGVGLKGYWKLDEASGTRYDYVHTNNLTDNNTVTQATGKVGNAGQFTATNNEYLSITDTADLSMGNIDFTLAAWVYLDSLPAGNAAILGKGTNWGTGTEYTLFVETSGSNKRFRVVTRTSGPGSGDLSATSFGALSTNTWYFVVAWYDSTADTVNIQINNGTVDSLSWTTGSQDTTGTFMIGWFPTWGASEDWDGRIDGTGVWKKVLTAAERTALYNGGNGVDFDSVLTFSPTSTTAASEEKGPGPVAYWRFDDGQGQTTQDSTTNNNDGTLGATSGSSTDDPSWQAEDLCVSGKCLKFDGTNDYVNVTNSSSLDNGNTTVSSWIKINTWVVNGTIYNRRTAANVGGVVLEQNTPAGTMTFYAYISGAWRSINTTGWSTNTWYHIAATYDGSNLRMYRNGVDLGSPTAISGTINNPSSPSVQIGRNIASPTIFFNGFIDDVKIYNYARSASQIQADYNARGTSKGASAALGGNNETMKQLSNGLVGYWKMNEASANSCSGGVNDNCDSSGNGNDGAWNGNATSAAGKYGNGTTFDGTGDYIDMGDPSSGVLDFSDSFTISTWVKTSQSLAASNYAAIVGKGYLANTTGYGLLLDGDNSSNVYFQSRNGSTIASVSGGSINNGAWHHVVGVREHGSNTSKIYVDGVLVATDSSTALSSGYSNSDKFGVGNRHLNTDGTWAHGFNGQADDVRIYNRALTPSEVEGLYNFAPGPVGYWNMEDGAGSTVADKSGQGNNGTLTVGASGTQTSASQAWTAGNPGKIGRALNFDGTDDLVDITDPSSGILDITSPITISAWVMPTNYNDYRSVISKGASNCATNCPFDVYLTSAAGYITFTRADAVNFFQMRSNTAVANNQWSHITVVDNGSTFKFYINGVETASTVTDPGYVIPIANANNVRIGLRTDSVTKMLGTIDDVRIYNYARTQKQIVEDMNAGHPAPGSPIGSAVGYWKLDEGYGTTAQDSGSQAALGSPNNLTLSAAAWTQSGKFGKAWDGTGARWLSRADDADFDFAAADDLAISLWLKSDSATNPGATEYLFNKASATVAGYAIYATTAGAICFGIDDDTVWTPDDTSCATSDIYDANWHHIVATKTGATRIDLYVDGKSIASDTAIAATASLENSLTMYIGDRDGVDNGDEFNGDLDEVKVYRGALTAAEVRTEYNRGSAIVLGALGDNTSYQPQAANQEYCIPGDTTSCASPVGRWDFNEKSGQTAYDTSGNANNGTLGASAAVGADDPTWSVGKKGAGLSFDGGDYVEAGTNTVLDVTTNLTISAWVKLGATNLTNSYILTKRVPNDNYALIYGFNSGKYEFYSDLYTGTAPRTALTTTVNDTQWHHIVWTYDGTTIKGYLDGVLDVSSNKTFTLGSNTATLRFGTSNKTTDFLNGSIDDVRIFNYARSAAQIAWDYNRGAPVAHWKFDEGQGGTLYDSSGNGNNGTWNGTAAGTQTAVGDINTSGTAWFNGKTGKRNYSLNFDGVDDYVNVPDSTTFNLPNDFTFSVWIKTTQTSRDKTILTKHDTSGAYDSYYFSINRDSLFTDGRVSLYDGGSWRDSAIAISDGNWHHVAVTYTGSTMRFYKDGLLISTFTSVTTAYSDTNQPLTIGVRTDVGYSYWNGSIDDVRIYNYALTPVQIKLLYNDGAVRFGPSTGAP